MGEWVTSLRNILNQGDLGTCGGNVQKAVRYTELKLKQRMQISEFLVWLMP